MKQKKLNTTLLFITLSLISACSSLPTSGPSYSEILASNENTAETQLPEVNLIKLDNITVQTYTKSNNLNVFQDLMAQWVWVVMLEQLM